MNDLTTTYRIIKEEDKYNIELINGYGNQSFCARLDKYLFRMICITVNRNFNNTVEELNLQTGFISIYEFTSKDQLEKVTDIIDEYLILKRIES